ncbi:MAG: T9SS type A sorting domain-containing protein [Bacteroidota bacterium]
MKNILPFLLCGFLLLSLAYGQDFFKSTKFFAPERNIGDFLGSTVAIDGDYAIAGSSLHDLDPQEGDSLANAGAAFIYERDMNGDWQFVQKIVPSDRMPNDRFGFNVDIEGNYAIVGAPNKSQAGLNGVGAAYVFERNGQGVWQEVAALFHANFEAFDNFGSAVILRGDTAMISCTFEDVNMIRDAGAVYVANRNMQGGWSVNQRLTASDPTRNANFGSAVDIEGGTAIIGAWRLPNATGGTNDASAGGAYVFTFDQMSQNWTQSQKLLPDTADWIGGDLFGGSVAIEGDFIFVAADGDDNDEANMDPIFDAGSIHIFRENMQGSWEETQKINAGDREEEAFFGQRIGTSGNRLVVGAPGEWESVFFSDSINDAGAIYLFEKDNMDQWIQVQKIVAPDREAMDFYGFSTAISGDFIIVGAQAEDTDEGGADSTANAGAVYFVEPCSLDTAISTVPGGIEADLADATYQWFACGIENTRLEGDTNKIFLPTQTGDYGVLLSKDGCTLPTACQNFITTDVRPTWKATIRLYPNPVVDLLNMTSEFTWSDVLVTIVDTKGKVIWYQAYRDWQNSQVDVSDWAEGAYIVRIETPTGTWSQPFLK